MTSSADKVREKFQISFPDLAPGAFSVPSVYNLVVKERAEIFSIIAEGCPRDLKNYTSAFASTADIPYIVDYFFRCLSLSLSLRSRPRVYLHCAL